jgi:hypothetical protein
MQIGAYRGLGLHWIKQNRKIRTDVIAREEYEPTIPVISESI